MEAYKGIMKLIRRSFLGTPKSEINYNNYEIAKMERKHLRYKLNIEVRRNKGLELKLRALKFKTVKI